jgi:hypothetical protein
MRYASAVQGELAVERLARWDESVTVIADKRLQKRKAKTIAMAASSVSSLVLSKHTTIDSETSVRYHTSHSFHQRDTILRTPFRPRLEPNPYQAVGSD